MRRPCILLSIANLTFAIFLWQEPPDEPEPLAIVLVLVVSVGIWIICIPRGIRAAHGDRAVRSLDVVRNTSLGALIAWLILRHLAIKQAADADPGRLYKLK